MLHRYLMLKKIPFFRVSGYGKFHYYLILTMVAGCSAQVYSSLTMSYVTPVAECDLQLTNNDKGALMAAVYVGEFQDVGKT